MALSTQRSFTEKEANEILENLRYISTKLQAMEMRQMEAELLPHEVIRRFLSFLQAYRPDGDGGWVLRNTFDTRCRWVRTSF